MKEGSAHRSGAGSAERDGDHIYIPLLGGYMQDIITLIVQNGIGVVCVAYLIYFQNNVMTKMLDTLNAIETRLSVIEEELRNKEEN